MIKMKELFDKPVEYQFVTSKNKIDYYSFQINQLYYKVQIGKVTHYRFMLDKLGEYFKVKNLDQFVEDIQKIIPVQKLKEYYDIHFMLTDQYGYAEITNVPGTGNEFAVFSTVKEIFEKELLTKYNPSFIKITSKIEEKSRIKLYKVFVQGIEKKYDYKFIGEGEDKQLGFANRYSFLLANNNIILTIKDYLKKGNQENL